MIKLLFFFLDFFSLGGWGIKLFFLHTCKNRYNFLMCSLIALKFGTNKEHIKVNSGTKFGMNLISMQCIMSDDSCKT